MQDVRVEGRGLRKEREGRPSRRRKRPEWNSSTRPASARRKAASPARKPHRRHSGGEQKTAEVDERELMQSLTEHQARIRQAIELLVEKQEKPGPGVAPSPTGRRQRTVRIQSPTPQSPPRSPPRSPARSPPGAGVEGGGALDVGGSEDAGLLAGMADLPVDESLDRRLHDVERAAREVERRRRELEQQRRVLTARADVRQWHSRKAGEVRSAVRALAGGRARALTRPAPAA